MFQVLNDALPQPTYSHQLPFFNWYYPFNYHEHQLPNPINPLLALEPSRLHRTAAYFHIPFCQTICRFCPFTRGRYSEDRELEEYVIALGHELKMKRHLFGRLKIDTLFFGGGTPSVLSASQIERLGALVHEHLDIDPNAECTFELEVKSVSLAKLEAMRSIGINRVSFGVQTFDKQYRDLFALDATLEQVCNVAEMANEMFSYTNIDMIHGIAGQSLGELEEDFSLAIALNTKTVDFYPLNNLASQIGLHKLIRESNKGLTSARARNSQRLLLHKLFKGEGYSPISGYGFARGADTNRCIQTSPTFQYHDIVYGYDDEVVVGYGSGALTQVSGSNIYNLSNRNEYVSRLNSGKVVWDAFMVAECPEKGLVTFPYRGSLDKSRIRWEALPTDTLKAFHQAIAMGLVVDSGKSYEVTFDGWLYYVNLMYHLMPSSGQRWITERINEQITEGRDCEDTSLVEKVNSVYC